MDKLGLSDIRIGGIRPIGQITNCLIYQTHYDPDATPISFGPAHGMALCPVDKIAGMAAQHVTVREFLGWKIARWLGRA